MSRRLIITLSGILASDLIGVLIAVVAVVTVSVSGNTSDSSPRKLTGEPAAHDPVLVAGASGQP